MSSKSIYGSFKPTYLYIKRHSVTEKLYFGKTTQDPETYLGSGKHWKAHIKKHGVEHVQTLWYCLFLDEESIKQFALDFSTQQNIVKSEDWLNLIPENGLDGGAFSSTGLKRSKETKAKISESNSRRVISSETKLKIRKGNTGKKRSNDTRAKMSAAFTGRKFSDSSKHKMSLRKINAPTVSCPHCGKEGAQSIMKRWHFNRCRFAKTPDLHSELEALDLQLK